MATNGAKKGLRTKSQVFEEQLRALQNEISSLSQNLSSHSISFKPQDLGTSMEEPKTNGKIIATNGANAKNRTIAQDERASREAEESLNMRLKGEITQLKLRLLESERDNTDLRHKSELLQKELEGYQKSLDESNRFRVLYEHLKQENDSLKISLESSERIRVQQKELIFLLQKTNSIGDAVSITSVGSISTIPSDKGNVSSTSISPSIAAENRSWLNNSFTIPAASNGSVQTPHVISSTINQTQNSTFLDEVSKLTNHTDMKQSTTSTQVVKTGIAELSSTSNKKSAMNNISAMSNESFPVAYTPPLPSNGQYLKGLAMLNSNQPNHIEALLNHKYLNFPAASQSIPESNIRLSQPIDLTKDSNKTTKRKMVTSSKKMTTAPRPVPLRNPMDRDGINGKLGKEREKSKSNHESKQMGRTPKKSQDSRRSSSPSIYSQTVRGKDLLPPQLHHTLSTSKRPSSAPPASASARKLSRDATSGKPDDTPKSKITSKTRKV